MCGIAGIIGYPDPGKARKMMEIMTGQLSHRGPDASGIANEGKAVLGHTRLSIIDLSDSANQPMTDASNRFVMVFNGEIFNYQEIRSELKDYPFQTNSDSEVILAAYQAWGKDCLHRFNGQFALAIWDRKEEKIFIARDRLGIKPLYYWFDGNVLAFASEMRPLIKSGLFRPGIDKAGLVDFLSWQTVHAPGTLVEGLKMLKPGTWAELDKDGLKIFTWWEIRRNWPETDLSPENTKSRILELLQGAVSRRMISDVPLGAFLSGGMDSSAIVALMARASEQPVDTFSVVFNEKEFDESNWSGLIAKKYNTRHHPILLKPSNFLDELPNALQSMDSPSGDGINSYVAAKVTRNAGITVALSGLGGDELFAGYPVFREVGEILKKSWLWTMPGMVRGLLAGIGRRYPGGRRGEKLAQLLGLESLDFENVYSLFRRVYSQEQIRKLQPGLPFDFNFVKEFAAGVSADIPDLSKISIAEMGTYTGNVLLKDMDQMSMAHSLEARVPFFDHTLVEFVLGIGDNLKYPHYPKKLMAEVLGELLPEEIVHRKKMGFVFPWEKWLRTELKEFCDSRIKSLAQREILRDGQIRRLWKDFLSGKNTLLWSHIWLLVVLEDWLSQNGINE